ncbi:hypothetical protein OAA71_01825 [Porticoccaceae bacterium]|nr:hypothetical protein [Porticoccaceae bacterium]
MNNISDEELLALQAAHIEVTTSQWQQVRRRILIRALVVIGLILSRALLLHLFPQTYEPLLFGSSGDLQSLIATRLWVGAGLGGDIFLCVNDKQLHKICIHSCVDGSCYFDLGGFTDVPNLIFP